MCTLTCSLCPWHSPPQCSHLCILSSSGCSFTRGPGPCQNVLTRQTSWHELSQCFSNLSNEQSLLKEKYYRGLFHKHTQIYLRNTNQGNQGFWLSVWIFMAKRSVFIVAKIIVKLIKTQKEKGNENLPNSWIHWTPLWESLISSTGGPLETKALVSSASETSLYPGWPLPAPPPYGTQGWETTEVFTCGSWSSGVEPRLSSYL